MGKRGIKQWQTENDNAAKDVDALLRRLSPGEGFEIPESMGKRMRDLVWTFTNKRGGRGYFKVKGHRVLRIS